jgi:hypothetical protein
MATVETAAEIRPFHVDIPEETLKDLGRRIEATRWPSKELVEDRSQGVQLATLRELARYWATDYDWRKVVSRAQRASRSSRPRSLTAALAIADQLPAESERSGQPSMRFGLQPATTYIRASKEQPRGSTPSHAAPRSCVGAQR